MNILILNWRDPKNPKAGGAEYVTHQHAKYWVSKGHMVTWFTSSFMDSVPRETIDNVRIIRKGSIITVFYYAFLFYIKNKKIVDVIVDEAHGIPFFSILYAKKPIILFIHEVAGDIWRIMYPIPIRWIGLLLERLFLFLYRNQVVWTDAQSTAKELKDMGIKKVISIPCPIGDIHLYDKPQKNISLTCIYVGRLVRMKRIEDILQAFAIISKSYPDALLHIVGDGDALYKNGLQDKVQNLGFSSKVEWHGRVSEKKKLALMSESHFLLHTSLKEGWGLVVMEAASQWTPSVVYGVSGLVDTVKNNETGVITLQETPDDLAREVIALYKDRHRYQVMQKQALGWSKQFRWADIAGQSHSLLTAVYKST